jgi:hypothetical protein
VIRLLILRLALVKRGERSCEFRAGSVRRTWAVDVDAILALVLDRQRAARKHRAAHPPVDELCGAAASARARRTVEAGTVLDAQGSDPDRSGRAAASQGTVRCRRSLDEAAALAFHAVLCLGGVLFAGITLPANAANWLLLEATEPPAAPNLASYAALSVEYQASQDTPLLAGAWSGQPDQFNRFAPRFARGKVLQISTAVAGAHGRLADGQLSYRLAVIAGESAIVRGLDGPYGGGVRLLDASLTLNLVPHARLRAGLFRQPLGEEATDLQQRHVNLSHVTQQMVQERTFASDGSVNGDANLDRGPVSAFRDVGVQVFDAIAAGDWEHTYAVMLGRGSGVDPTLNHAGIEQYVYWSSERIFAGKGPQRDGLKLYAWGQFGHRHLDVGPTQALQTFARRRAGVGASLRTGPWSMAAEWIDAHGMIYHGPDGGAIPGSLSNSGALIAGYNVLPESAAHGWYVDGGYRIAQPLELRLRYDVLNRGTDNPNTEIRFQGVTVGGSYALAAKTLLVVDYQFRRYNAPRLSSASPTNVLLDGVDNRIGIRLSRQFSF